MLQLVHPLKEICILRSQPPTSNNAYLLKNGLRSLKLLFVPLFICTISFADIFNCALFIKHNNPVSNLIALMALSFWIAFDEFQYVCCEFVEFIKNEEM